MLFPSPLLPAYIEIPELLLGFSRASSLIGGYLSPKRDNFLYPSPCQAISYLCLKTYSFLVNHVTFVIVFAAFWLGTHGERALLKG